MATSIRLMMTATVSAGIKILLADNLLNLRRKYFMRGLSELVFPATLNRLNVEFPTKLSEDTYPIRQGHWYTPTQGKL